jgi:hypothetical protein
VSTTGKQISVLKVLIWATAPVGLLVLAMVVAPFVWSWEREQRWQAYCHGADTTRKALDLPALPPPIDPALNFAGEAPFAAIPVDAEGHPTQPPSLPTEWLPKQLITELDKPARLDLNEARETLHLEKVPAADLPAAILRACDEHLAGKWQTVLSAEAKPQTRFGLQPWPIPATAKIPIADLRNATQVHVIRAVALLHAHRGGEAAKEMRGIVRIATALQGEKTIVAQVMRAAVLRLYSRVVWQGLSDAAWSDAELAALEQEVASLHASTGYAEAIDTERGWMNAAIECLVAQSTSERMRQIHQWFPGKEAGNTMVAMLCRSRGVLRDNQLLINRHLDVVRTQVDDKGNWQPTDLPFNFDTADNAVRIRYALASIFVMDYSRAEQHLLSVETYLRQARLAVALERFRREHGAFPDHLNQLEPVYVRSILADPMDGEPMRYAKDSANRFRLWSVGQNLDDDGGKLEVKEKEDEQKGEPEDIVWLGEMSGT